MSESIGIEAFLGQARKEEWGYDWLGAAGSYNRALDLMPMPDFLRMGETYERLGYAFYRAAMQAESQEEFRDRMRLSVANYEKAADLFNNIEGLEKLAKTSHCKAMVTYINSWLSADLPAKRELLDECWKLEKEVLKVYEKTIDRMNVGKACNNLMIFLIDRLNIEWNAKSREEIIDEALEYGERAIEIFSTAQDRPQLVQAYITTAFFDKNAAFVTGFQPERREEYRQKALGYHQKAIEISEEIDDAYLIGLSSLCLADARLDILGTSGLQERQHYEKALNCAILTKDNILMAGALWGLNFATTFIATTQEDPDKAREEYKKLDQDWDNAIRHYSLVGHNLGMALSYFLILWSIEWRSGLETTLENRRLLLEKFVELGYRGLNHARLSGSMGATHHSIRALSNALFYLAKIETEPGRKRNFLNESARLIEQGISILKEASATSLVEPKEGNLTASLWALGACQAELANMEENVDEKIRMLENAIASMRSAHETLLKWTKSPWAHIEKPHWFGLGERDAKTGKMLNQLYSLTNNRTLLRKSAEAFEQSIDAYERADVPSRVAEAYWQIAKTYDQLEEYSESAKNFELASKNYGLAAERMPKLKGFYMDYASYMQAWSEIEKARDCHSRHVYGLAEEHFKKAANIHKSLKQWDYLSLNYSAWAQVEHAEDLSRKEQSEEAIQAFEQSDQLFRETKKSLEAQLSKVESIDEKQMATHMLKASDLRREYCMARIALEEAKNLDKKGDHYASAEKYSSVAETFEKIYQLLDSEQDRKEFKLITSLSRAWQKMTLAEAEASPTLYGEASQLFEEAKDLSPSEQAKMLALGHSRFCRALEAGTRFADTRDITMHAAAIRYLESAATYYVNAGFQKASDFAKATRLLFDAYVHMDDAKEENDPEKKTKLCMMAERVLQTAADSFMKADHPEKREQALRLLEEVQEERELALSLTEILHVPSIVSSTTAFPTPTPTYEEAVGLEKFEHAEIQANVITRQKELYVGDNLNLEIELINAGKGAALLTKITNAFPESFEIVEKPEICRVEDSCLNMKGKRLDPLRTKEVKLVLKPKIQGAFSLKPTILYLDEKGKHKAHEPQPVSIIVKELGIRGWLKGEK